MSEQNNSGVKTSHGTTIEFRDIEIDSPISSLKVGEDYAWSGTYLNIGYQEGVNKIEKIVRSAPFEDGVEIPKMVGYTEDAVWLVLDNKKKFLLGYIDGKNEFTTLEDYIKINDLKI